MKILKYHCSWVYCNLLICGCQKWDYREFITIIFWLSGWRCSAPDPSCVNPTEVTVAENMGQIEEAKMSCLNSLTYHRELLVSRLRSVQCILDNLLACGFVCEEDVEIIQQTATKTEQVGKQKKGKKEVISNSK